LRSSFFFHYFIDLPIAKLLRSHTAEDSYTLQQMSMKPSSETLDELRGKWYGAMHPSLQLLLRMVNALITAAEESVHCQEP
jgi:hypothetical protein